MKKDKVYWTTKDGQKIDVDTMDIDHLRNIVKMLVKNKKEPEHSQFYRADNIEPYAFDYLWKD